MVAALLGSAVAANAGGFERGSQDFDILFEKAMLSTRRAPMSLRSAS
ncbi:hypothetical protein HED49_08425 [Ochrobactrum daejeonense]|nr:hypothetical protein [Brucella daejeonensis]